MQNTLSKYTTKNLVLSALFTAIVAVCAQISIQIGPVPFTLQVLAIFLASLILPPKYAFLSLLVYDLLGAVGVPVFAGFTGGLSKFVGPTGGYLIAFPIAAFVTSYINTKKPIKNEAANASAALILGLVIIYTFGFLYLSWAANMTLKKAFAAGVAPFIIPDIIKLAIAYFLARAIKSRKVLNIA
ncbi:BioY protein [Caldicellulosiruptor owensensis OL]|uniref:Biotin transporter n=1 Tax=Caldicellulosiruptor owensensis (strain ATCC 700167 / DSM 13100 / OL) TaxID=632518 RepID=E4Q745_CALOW|nr:biotin transporter BioY [Caldicellulosiruptor owensensis]ADQ05725.1 BioY protein [Caldicellulosiruptor owensensis OL]